MYKMSTLSPNLLLVRLYNKYQNHIYYSQIEQILDDIFTYINVTIRSLFASTLVTILIDLINYFPYKQIIILYIKSKDNILPFAPN